MNGHGMLTVTDEGQGRSTWAIKEGASVVVPIGRQQFAFVLERAPELEHYDIRKMTAAAIAKFLASRLEEEAEQADSAWEYTEE